MTPNTHQEHPKKENLGLKLLGPAPIQSNFVGRDYVFSPSRLTLARQRRGMTKKALAEELRVTADAITKFEKAVCKPTPENVVRCATALRFPLSWFYADEIALLNDNAPSFRSRRSMTAELKAKATRAGDISASIISPFLHKKFILPEIDVPDLSEYLSSSNSDSDLENEQIAAAANELRVRWNLGIGPIGNMVHLLESKGIEVFWLNEESSSLDAWSVWLDNRPFVLLNRRTDAGCRGRFDAAHELGHLVLHRGEKIIDGLSLERQANQFASAFLLAPEQFRRECPGFSNLRAFFPLKKRWGVSIAAMIMQCQTLGVFSEWTARSAFKALAANGWRQEEPAEIAIPREVSAIHPLLWEQIRNQGFNSQSFARQLNLNEEDIWELMPVTDSRNDNRPQPNLRLL